MIDFTTIDYLKTGNEKQKIAYEVLTKYNIFEKLKCYSPILVGTIPIEIDIENSDLDIICEVDLNFENDFLEVVMFSRFIPDDIEVKVDKFTLNDEDCITLNFSIEGFLVEIFGQNIPTKKQNGYLHMLAEYRILQEMGDGFRKQIKELKKKGIKTESAFGCLMNLENPYVDLLNF